MKRKIRLGVNVDHVATVRNARGECYPSPVQAAAFAELGGADNITCHLREDRRHIVDRDVFALKDTISLPLNFEMAATSEMVAIAEKVLPFAVTLVPEKREELTTEGGLLLKPHFDKLERMVGQLKEKGILVSLFLDPNKKDMELAKKLGADAVEIHTGDFCESFKKPHKEEDVLKWLTPFKEAASLAHELSLSVHVGHGLNYQNAHYMQAIPFCEEANIGHAIVARSMQVGLSKAVETMKDLLNDDKYAPF